MSLMLFICAMPVLLPKLYLFICVIVVTVFFQPRSFFFWVSYQLNMITTCLYMPFSLKQGAFCWVWPNVISVFNLLIQKMFLLRMLVCFFLSFFFYSGIYNRHNRWYNSTNLLAILMNDASSLTSCFAYLITLQEFVV